MPLIELLRPEQRAWLRRLRRRIANRELMRRTRADINRKLLCPGVDLPIEAGTCGRLIWPESSRCIYCHNRRTWLLKYAMNKAEVVITALLENAALFEPTRGSTPTRPPSSPTPSPSSTTCPLSAIPACGGSGGRRRSRSAPRRRQAGRVRPGSNLEPLQPALPCRCPGDRPDPAVERARRPWKEQDGHGKSKTTVERMYGMRVKLSGETTTPLCCSSIPRRSTNTVRRSTPSACSPSKAHGVAGQRRSRPTRRSTIASATRSSNWRSTCPRSCGSEGGRFSSRCRRGRPASSITTVPASRGGPLSGRAAGDRRAVAGRGRRRVRAVLDSGHAAHGAVKERLIDYLAVSPAACPEPRR